MAFKHGKATSVYLDALDLSPFLTSADLGVDVDTAETTTYGSAWKTFLVGTAGAKASFAGLYDPTLTKLQSAVTVDYALTSGVLTYCPAGAVAIGDQARLLQVATASYAESSPVGGIVAVKYDAQASAAVGFGEVLHLNSVDTGTTTGAWTDDLAASATGWTAHLHIIAVSSGTWTVKLQDSASAAGSHSDAADVTGGSFTAQTSAAAQRLQAATNTTALRRYTRYVATVSGGSSPTITFVLAYARNQ